MVLFQFSQFSPITDWVVGGTWGTIQRRSSSSLFCRGPLRAVLACPHFDVVHPEFPVPTMAPPTLQGALKGGFGKDVVVYDMPEPCKLSFLGLLPGFCGSTRKLTLLQTQSLVLCSNRSCDEISSILWSRKPESFGFFFWFFFSQQAEAKFHSLRGRWR